jgi:threonine synthase
MSTWATVAAATVLGATEGDAGGEAAGALVDTAGLAVVVTTTVGAALCAWVAL